MQIKIKILLAVLLFSAIPFKSSAISMPFWAEIYRQIPVPENLTAHSFVVADKETGQVLAAKDPDSVWPTASMAKLMTAMVFLDSKPDLEKIITAQKSDLSYGSVLPLRAGYQYRLNDIFYSMLIPSANDAAKAVARESGIPLGDFVRNMNQKAADLGALSTVFVEPTGLSPKNITTASDFAKIIKAAIEYPEISQALSYKSYSFSTVRGVKKSYKINNTNQLLGDQDFEVAGGKTGFLEQSLRNFSGLLKDRFGNEFTVVLLGSKNQHTQFAEVKEIASLGGLAKIFFRPFSLSAVLGAATSTNNLFYH